MNRERKREEKMKKVTGKKGKNEKCEREVRKK